MTALQLHDLSQLSLICFSGEDAEGFLQSQLSCDVSSLTSNNSAYGSYCTPKGRILSTFLLWRSEQGFFMQLPSPLREPIQKQVSKYILRSKSKRAMPAANSLVWALQAKALDGPALEFLPLPYSV